MTQVSRDGFHGSSTDRASSVLPGWERWLRPWALDLPVPGTPFLTLALRLYLASFSGTRWRMEAAVYHLQMWPATPGPGHVYLVLIVLG